jgi:hypothetical protein
MSYPPLRGWPHTCAIAAIVLAGSMWTVRPVQAEPPPRTASVKSTTAGQGLELPAISRGSDDRPWRSFMSSPGLSFEAMGMIRGIWGDANYDGAAYLRAMANLRLGPLVLGVGAIVGAETLFNVHLELFSFQSAGWEVAAGGGWFDGGTLRLAFPLIDGLRGRVMTSFGPAGFSGGLGLEVEPW